MAYNPYLNIINILFHYIIYENRNIYSVYGIKQKNIKNITMKKIRNYIRQF